MIGMYRVECVVRLNRVERIMLFEYRKGGNIIYENILKWLFSVS